jgi:hypothetical protein
MGRKQFVTNEFAGSGLEAGKDRFRVLDPRVSVLQRRRPPQHDAVPNASSMLPRRNARRSKFGSALRLPACGSSAFQSDSCSLSENSWIYRPSAEPQNPTKLPVRYRRRAPRSSRPSDKYSSGRAMANALADPFDSTHAFPRAADGYNGCPGRRIRLFQGEGNLLLRCAVIGARRAAVRK